MRLIVAMIALLGICPMLAAGQDEPAPWREIDHVDGIRVLAIQDEGSPILKVKAVAVIDSAIDKVIAVVEDVTRQSDWVPYLTETRLLQQRSQTEWLLYSRFDAPWPARDRDFVYRIEVSQQPGGSVIYRQISQQSELMPPRDDYVRAELLEGSYTLTALAPDKTQVELLFHADPRGRLPLWIVNIVQRRFPLEALQGLRRQVQMISAGAID